MLAGERSSPELLGERARAHRLARRDVLGDAVVEHLPGARAELGHATLFLAPPGPSRALCTRRSRREPCGAGHARGLIGCPACRRFWPGKGATGSVPKPRWQVSRRRVSCGVSRRSRSALRALRAGLRAGIACAAPVPAPRSGRRDRASGRTLRRRLPRPRPPAQRYGRSTGRSARRSSRREASPSRGRRGARRARPRAPRRPAPRRHVPPGLPAAERATSPWEIVDCRLALALDDFARAARRARHRRGHPLLDLSARHARGAGTSRHAHGARHRRRLLREAGRHHLEVERDFHGRIGAPTCGAGAGPSPATAEALELRSIVCDAAGARLFNVVLTPDYNWPHRNHFHLEVRADTKWLPAVVGPRLEPLLPFSRTSLQRVRPRRDPSPIPAAALLGAPHAPLRARRGLRDRSRCPSSCARAASTMIAHRDGSQTASLPHIIKPFWSPALDSGPRRRTWYFASIAVTAIALAATALVPPSLDRARRARVAPLGLHRGALRRAGRRRDERLRGPRDDGGHGARRARGARVGLADGGQPRRHRDGRGAHRLDDCPSRAATTADHPRVPSAASRRSRRRSSTRPRCRGGRLGVFWGPAPGDRGARCQSREGWTGMLICLSPVGTGALTNLFSALARDYAPDDARHRAPGHRGRRSCSEASSTSPARSSAGSSPIG